MQKLGLAVLGIVLLCGITAGVFAVTKRQKAQDAKKEAQNTQESRETQKTEAATEGNGPEEQEEEETLPKGVIEVDGKLYEKKKNIETYLFMGIDASGKVQKRTEYDGSGQCDMLMLLVRDLSTGTFKTLPIDRNTMTEVDTLEDDGEYIATTVVQLALAYSNGDGMEISCDNAVKSVSNYLWGQEIDGYAAINMSAIGIINEMIGGVTVTIEDDFSKVDPTMKMGETITLTNEQAEHFVRGRMEVGDGSNEGRMRRQSVYLAAAKPQLAQKCKENAGYPAQIYEGLGDYMVTNITSQKFSKIAMLALKEKDDGELQIKGTSQVGDLDLIEFEPDEDSLKEVILELFYREYK